jgi:hypothetical protein
MIVRVQYRRIGSHVHADVFIGRRADLTFAKSGTLIFRAEEWEDARDVLLRHAEQIEIKSAGSRVIHCPAEPVS